MSQTKVSIIMPVYNSEKFLQQTLQSIMEQSFQDYELIAINDGSTDGSRKILEDYAYMLQNMQIINQVNAGVSAARNKGLLATKGEYVCFMDADDWIHPDFLRILVGISEKNRADITFCEYEPFYNIEQLDQAVIDERTIMLTELKKNYGSSTFDYAMQMGLGTSPCNKMFRRDVLCQYQIYFDVNSTFGEDMFFNWKVFLISNNVYYVKKSLYGYRQNIEGATFKYHPHLYESYKNEYEKLLCFAEENGVLNEQLYISVKYNFAMRIPSILRMNQRRKVFTLVKYKFVRELIEKKDIYEAVEVLQRTCPIQNRMNKLLYNGILKHKTIWVFVYGCYAEYRFRVGRMINYLRKTK